MKLYAGILTLIAAGLVLAFAEAMTRLPWQYVAGAACLFAPALLLMAACMRSSQMSRGGR
jgi:carbon starvation protein CstA